MINTVDSNAVVRSGQQPAAITASLPGEAVTSPQTKPDPSTVEATVAKLNDHIQNISHTLSFSVDAATGHTIIRVYDSETQELIREIPSEETIKMASEIDSYNAIHLLKSQKA